LFEADWVLFALNKIRFPGSRFCLAQTKCRLFQTRCFQRKTQLEEVSEVLVGPDDGFPEESSTRCDFITLMMKTKLTHFVGTLSQEKQGELGDALVYAFQLNS